MIKDPLGQTHTLASSKHYFHSKYDLFCIWKSGDCGSAEWIKRIELKQRTPKANTKTRPT